MASFTSESDSNSFAGEMQPHWSYYFFSLTTDVNRVYQNPVVPTVTQNWYNNIKVRAHFVLHPAVCQFPFRLQTMAKGFDYNNFEGVRVHFILLPAVCQFPIRLQSMVTLKEGDQWQMWEFIPI